MACALEPWWSSTNHFREGLNALDAGLALQASAPERTRGRALLARSLLQRRLNPRESRRAAEQAVALAAAAGDLEGHCMALDALVHQTAFDGEFAAAGRLARQSLALAEQLDEPYHVGMALLRQTMTDPALELTTVRALAEQAEPLLRRCGATHRIAELMTHVVMSAFDNQDYEAANDLAADGLRAAEVAGNLVAIQAALGNAGLAALFLERMDVAERHFRRQLAICRRERLEGRWGEPALGLAIVAAKAANYERAATLVGACEPTIRETVAEADQSIVDRMIDRFINPARIALGDAEWTRAAVAGAALTRAEMYDVALEQARGAVGKQAL